MRLVSKRLVYNDERFHQLLLTFNPFRVGVLPSFEPTFFEQTGFLMTFLNISMSKDNFYERAQAFMDVNRYEEAGQLLAQAIATEPDEPLYRFQLARVLLQMENYPKAYECCMSAIHLDPEFAGAYYLSSLTLHHLLNFDGELRMAEEAVRLDPENETFLVRLGEAQLQSGLIKKAGETADQVMYLDPGSVEAHKLIGDISLKLDNDKKAEKHYREALRHEPDDIALLNDLARAQVGQKKWREAIDTLHHVLCLDPSEKILQDNLYLIIHEWLNQQAVKKRRKTALEELPAPVRLFYLDSKKRRSFFTSTSRLTIIAFWLLVLTLLSLLFSSLVE